MILGICTKITAVMIVGAVIWEIASLVGVVIIWNELYKRIKIKGKSKKTSNPSKKYEPKTQKVFKRVCAKCGAELQNGEKTFCRNCDYELQHTKCSECDSYFPKDDMHLVEGKYYCQACFKKKFVDFGAYENSENQTALERERESAVNSEVPENEYQSMAENKAAVKTSQSDADNKTITCFMMIKDLFTVRSKNMPSKNILNQFCKANVYIIYTNATMLPVCFMDRLSAYDSFEKAIIAIDKYIANDELKKHFYVQQIKPERLVAELKKYNCSGYGSLVINNESLVKFSDLPVYKKNEDYGNVCPEACNYMISFKEQLLAIECDEKTTGNARTVKDQHKLNALFEETVRILDQSTLLLPEVQFRKMTFENKEVVMVFTDQFAIDAYKNMSSIKFRKTTIDELYCIIEKDESISGIIVNPGREDFRMKKQA